MQRNKKIGDRKSDLVCHKCGRELVWEGSILEGKMVCKNIVCVEMDHGLATISNSDYGITGIYDSQAVSPSIKINKVLQRYYMDSCKGHRSWCDYLNKGICDCGYTQPCPYSDTTIERFEKLMYGELS